MKRIVSFILILALMVPFSMVTFGQGSVNKQSGWRTGESIGNLRYGVVGSVLFASGTLKSAAGMYQVYKGTSSFSYLSSYFDDPNDTADIVIGIGYHSSWNLNKVWPRL